jgi:ABC-type Mn2+/Zn2+ transport system permease subunit
MLYISAGVAVLATLVGTWMAVSMHRPSGPLIVLTATGIFLLSLVRRPA